MNWSTKPWTRPWLKATPVLWLALAVPAAAAPTADEFDIPTAAAVPEDIVQGPDGNLWFAENGIDKIGRVTPGDPPVIEEFALPTGFTDPFNITVGPDDKIWFTCKDLAGAVCRMNPANPADTQGKGGYNVTTPAGIAAGPDGKIWLGDSAQGKVVRMLDRLSALKPGDQVAMDQILMVLLSCSVLGERFQLAA